MHSVWKMQEGAEEVVFELDIGLTNAREHLTAWGQVHW